MRKEILLLRSNAKNAKGRKGAKEMQKREKLADGIETGGAEGT